MRKIFTQILYLRLVKWVESNNKISSFQAGFRANLSTIDQIFTLTSVARRYIDKKKKLYAFFVDFRAAFDTINRKSLLFKLSCSGLSSKIIKVYEQLLLHTTAVVSNGTNTSKQFMTKSGVPQGCILSPLTFSLYINDIEDNIPGGVMYGDIPIKILLYADDLVILTDNPVTLQLQINKLKNYCDLWDLEINSTKSKIMIFESRSRHARNVPSWNLNGSNIEIVKEFKYLGFTISHNLSLQPHIKDKLTTAKVAINCMWSKYFSNKIIDPASKFKVFDATVKNCLCYGNEVYGFNQIEDIEMLQRYFFKRIFRLPFNTPNYAIYVESGLPPIYLKNLKANADYIIKVMQRNGDNLQKKILQIALRWRYTPFQNWFDLAAEYNSPLELSVVDLHSWRSQFYDCIGAIDETLYQRSLNLAKESISREIFRNLNLTLGALNYFRTEFSCKEITLIFKARTEMLELNYRPYRNDIYQICTFCNLNQVENIFHFLAVCPILQEIRRLYFERSSLTFEMCLNVLNGEFGWKSLAMFLSEAITFRKTYINLF